MNPPDKTAVRFKTNKRKKYLIYKGFQLRMIMRVIGLMALSIVISGMLAYGITAQAEKSAGALLYEVTDNYQEDIKLVSRRALIAKSQLAGGALSIMIGAVFMLFYSHRLAGPVVKLKKSLETMAAGNYEEKVVFRKHDEFKELAEIMNRLQARLKAKET
jgi:methyl-accepting chemotaxis protein